MALARVEFDATNEAGDLLSNVTVEVRLESTNALVSVYSDRSGTLSLGNPFVVADGKIAFHAAGGAYKITLTSGSYSRTLRYVKNGLASETDISGVISGRQITNTTDYTILASDAGSMIAHNSATSHTFGFEPAATLGSAFLVIIKNIGDGVLVLTPDGAETIDLLSSIVLTKGQSVMVASDGSSLRTMFNSISPLVESFGARGDAATDDSAAFTAMLNAYGYIQLTPNKIYVVKDIVLNGQRLIGNGARLRPAPGAKFILKQTGWKPEIEGPLELEDSSDVVVNSTTLASTASTAATSIVVTSATGFEVGQWIAFRLDNDEYHGSFISAISSTTITLRRALPYQATAGLPVVTSWGMLNIMDSTRVRMDNVHGINSSVGVFIENVTQDSKIERCKFENCKYGGWIEGRDVADVTVSDSVFRGGHVETQTPTGDGSTKIFYTAWPMWRKIDVVVTVGGVVQTQGTDYTISSRFGITFTTAPASSAAIVITNSTDGWFGYFNDQKTWVTIRGGCQYNNIIILDFYYGRYIYDKVLGNWSQCIVDTCEVGEYIRGSDTLAFDNDFIGYVDKCMDVNGNSDIRLAGGQYLERATASDLVSGSVDDVMVIGSGSTVNLDVTGLEASSLQRSGAGDLNLKGSIVMAAATTATIPSGTTIYLGPAGEKSTESSGFLVSRDAKLVRIRARNDTNPGTGETYTYTVRKNGADTSLTGSIAAGVWELNFESSGVSVVAGDHIAVKLVTSSSAAAGNHRLLIEAV